MAYVNQVDKLPKVLTILVRFNYQGILEKLASEVMACRRIITELVKLPRCGWCPGAARRRESEAYNFKLYARATMLSAALLWQRTYLPAASLLHRPMVRTSAELKTDWLRAMAVGIAALKEWA